MDAVAQWRGQRGIVSKLDDEIEIIQSKQQKARGPGNNLTGTSGTGINGLTFCQRPRGREEGGWGRKSVQRDSLPHLSQNKPAHSGGLRLGPVALV